MDPTTNTDTPAEIPADAQDADDVRGSIVTPVTPSLASYVGGGPSLTARARGSSRQRQLLQAAVNAFIRDDDDPSSVELADAISGFERMDMFLITTHEDIAEIRGTTGTPLSQAQRQRINVIRDFLLQQQDLCAEGRLTVEGIELLTEDDFDDYVAESGYRKI